MEVAGVAIGAASLMSLFKTCLDMYDTIECGRQYGADYEVLTTKVGIERMRLLLWGDTVGLPGLGIHRDSSEGLLQAGAIDPRLNDPRIVKAVADILHCMRQLFDDTSSMTRRYGLTPASSSAVAAVAQAGSQLATVGGGGRNALVTTFRKTYARLQTSAARTQRAASLATTMRWAIKDKKRFQRFIDDLRSFNDSLDALFPDVGPQAREAMVAEIKASTDLDDLHIVEQAAGDLENGGEQLAEAASLRITEISQYTASLATNDDDDDEDLDTELDSISIQGVGDVNIKSLTRQLEKLDVALRKELKGSLQLSIWCSFDPDYHAFLTWEGTRGDEYTMERDKELEYVKVPYLAWSLMHATEKKRNEQGDFSRQDSEASRKFEGRFPGTRTIEGYAACFSEWARTHKPGLDSERMWYTVGEIPAHSVADLVDRLRDLQLRRALPWGETDESASKHLAELLGESARTKLMPGFRYDASMQVIDLLSMLSRSDVFDDVRDGGSLGIIAMAGPRSNSLANFLYQMVVAYELKLRLARAGDTAFGNMSGRVVAAMQAAERWVDGVWVKMPDRKAMNVEMHSLVHERQVEGLVRFAELMAWPALGEMREFVEDAYADLRAGMCVSPNLWDWLFGAMLPGNAFVFTIMSALVAATPSLKSLGAPKYYGSGLVLDDRSYWRAKWVLGRVLGGIRGIKAANGWIGPCPVPVGTNGEKLAKGWWRVRARDTAFALPEPDMSDEDEDESGIFSSLHRVPASSSHAEWVRTMADPTKWVVPVGPSNAPDTVEFRALRFKSMARQQAVREVGSQEGIGPSTATNTSDASAPPTPLSRSSTLAEDNSKTDTPTADEREPEQRAFLDLLINNQPVSFTLYNNPVFVATPRCIDGPHPVHERDLPKMQHILRVSQLQGYVHNDQRVLVIDATGRGECELAARAWCAEHGQHAILRRGSGTCFACAVRAASAEGLGVGCLIWT